MSIDVGGNSSGNFSIIVGCSIYCYYGILSFKPTVGLVLADWSNEKVFGLSMSDGSSSQTLLNSVFSSLNENFI
jgi:hypothetical protein